MHPAHTTFRAGKYLTFRIARQEFAMDASVVRAILPITELTLIASTSPWAKEWTCGYAALKGRDFPVIDIRAKLQIPAAPAGRQPCIIVVEVEDQIAGFVADRISEVVQARERDFIRGKLRMGRPREILDVRSLI